MNKLCYITGLSITLLFLNSLISSAQEEYNFIPDREKFNQELIRFFDKYGTQDSKGFLTDFFNYTAETELEENEWIAIAEVTNILAGRLNNPYSNMMAYIKALTSFKFNPDRIRNFQVWTRHVQTLLLGESRKMEPLARFLEFTSGLHNENLLFSSRTISWKLSAPDYKFSLSEGFFIQTGRVNLTGIAGRDSSRLQSTSGRFYPAENAWIGQGGKISWEKLGLDINSVFVSLPDYNLDLSKSVYSIDSVNLTDRRYFKNPIIGRLDDKISIGVSPERSVYPRFSSYSADHRIKSIFRDMDYHGGYSLEGLKIIGAGLGEQKGEIMVFKDSKPLMQLNSRRYVFDEEGAKGLNTSALIFIDSDSIRHPGLFFQYKKDRNELVLMRDGKGSSNSKFFDSFHQLTVDVGMMTWYPGDSLLYLSGMFGALENNAVFESAGFFSIQWFNEIQIADLKNPLVLVKRCADQYHSRYYYSTDLAEFMKKPIHLVEEMLLNVSYLGFLQFDPNTKLVHVLQRTYDFLDQHAGLMDYDIIRFRSNIEPPNPNAIINLRTGSMQVFGVPGIDLSNSRYVKLFPARQELTIDRGRNMSFEGNVQAGLLSFEGSDFIFNYEDFQLFLNTVDLVRLKVHIPLVKDYQETRITDLSSTIENTRGMLQIDEPDNKAGLEPELTPQYPSFRFDTTAYVYYDQKHIQNGAYTRDSFFFEINPNTLVGLNDVRFREKLFFPGTFYTHNIFPAIELDLVYRDDNSLGFDTLSTPEEGYPVYVDKGIFYNDISMNTSGLRGSGTLEYLGSTLESKNFLFLPDQVRVEADRFFVDKNSSELGNPEIFGENLEATWMINENSLQVNHRDNPLSIYGNGSFTGKIFIEPESIRAGGTLAMDGYTVSSEDFIFMDERFEMKDGQLVIHSTFQDEAGDAADSAEADFVANNIDGYIDLKNNIGDFTGSEGQPTQLLFPVNKYKSDQSAFTWDMNTNKVYLEHSTLTSTRKDQNSLSFESGQSVYDINTYTIEANEVPWIDVADMRVFPGQNQALIRANAVLDSLPGSNLVSRDTTLGHEFRNSLVKIRGKNNYSASGNYIYTDITGRELLLPFYEIGASSDRQSKGQAKVDSLAPFNISPEFAFTGNIDWENQDKDLSFKGSYMLNYDCPDITRQWIRMDTKISADNVRIPVDSISRSLEGGNLRQGFFISNQPVEMYSTFLGPVLNYTDHPIITGFGEIRYDYEKGQYLIQDPALADSSFTGPVLYLDNNRCIAGGEGTLDFGMDLGQVKMDATGSIKHDLVKDSILTDQILAVDFFLDEELLLYFVSAINNRGGLQPVNYSRPEYQSSIKRWLGEKRGQEILNELGLIGSFRKIPGEFNHTILFTDLKMKWNPEKGSYQSVGKIGIGNVNDQSVNKLVDGHLELVRRRSGDTFTLYVEFDSNAYFFFYYNRGLMQVLAGPAFEEFNNIVRDIKPGKRKLKGGLFRKLEGPRYEFALGQFRLVRNFLDELNGN